MRAVYQHPHKDLATHPLIQWTEQNQIKINCNGIIWLQNMQISEDYNLCLFVVHDDDDGDDNDGGGDNNQQQSKEFSSCIALIHDPYKTHGIF